MRLSEFPLVSEIKEEYIKLRQGGTGRAEATEMLKRSYSRELTSGQRDDGILFWIGLADGQYAVQELSEEVAKAATNALEALMHSGVSIATNDIRRRFMHYSNAPMPEQQQVQAPRKYRCTWKKGDVFAYLLSGQLAITQGIAGKYVILRVVDVVEFDDGAQRPVAMLTMWDSDLESWDPVVFSQMHSMILAYGRYGMPSSLFEYRAVIWFRTHAQEKKVPLKYLGNILDMEAPSDEGSFLEPQKLMMLCPEHFDRDCVNFWRVHTYVVQNLRKGSL